MPYVVLEAHSDSTLLTPEKLGQESRRFCRTGGVSENNRCWGFQAAFLDTDTGRVYLSRFADGRPAPVHVLDGLPEELVLARSGEGRVLAAKQTVVAGFVYADHFYTREQAAGLLAG